MNVVEIKGLIKKYNNIIALKDINLSIGAEEIYGLLGPNGSGKSTLINILSGIIKYDRGICEVLGKDVIRDSKYIKKCIGVVPQEYSFYNDLKVKENMQLFGRLYGLKGRVLNKRIEEILERLDLSEYGNKYPVSFSGGMKRKVNIACSLIHNPKILIMDEPTASLDPIARDYVLNIVKEINKDGCTVIYTSHYLEEVDYLCDRAAILNNGVVIAEGSMKDINNIFKKRNIIDIEVSKLNKREMEKITNIKSQVLFLSNSEISINDKYNSIRIKCDNQAIVLERVLMFLRENNIGIKDISISKASLEDTFVRLINK